MDCESITRIPVAQKAIYSKDERLINQLFKCIYNGFHRKFIGWIIATNPGDSIPIGKDELEELAKDSFQEGLVAFCKYTETKPLEQKGSSTLYDIIKTFGRYQFMALKKAKARRRIENERIDSGFEKINSKLLQIPDTEIDHIGDAEIQRAIDDLPSEKFKKVIRLRYFEQLKTLEIASALGVTVGDVFNTLCQAKKALRLIIEAKLKSGAWNS